MGQIEIEPGQLLAAASLAAEQAAAFLRRQEGRLGPEAWVSKAPADFVTEVDRESERIVGSVLRATYPGSVVLGEELSPGEEVPDGLVWIVDPLDGTTNFLHRFPCYCVSIAAALDGELLAGVVHEVPHDIRYTATKGGGAFQDGSPIRVSSISDPQHALIGTGVPFKDQTQMARYQKQLSAVSAATSGVRRPGSAALDLCWVAAGVFDGFWEIELAPWDIAAGVLMIREAGGVVTDFDGATNLLRRTSVVAGNADLHRWLTAAISGAR